MNTDKPLAKKLTLRQSIGRTLKDEKLFWLWFSIYYIIIGGAAVSFLGLPIA